MVGYVIPHLVRGVTFHQVVHEGLRLVSNLKMTARQMLEKAGVTTHVKNVRQVLRQCKHLKRKKLQRKPVLSEQYKSVRLVFAEKHIQLKKK